MKAFSTSMEEWLLKTAKETATLILGAGPAMDSKYVLFGDQPCTTRTTCDILKEDSHGGKTVENILMEGLVAVGVMGRAGGVLKKGVIVTSMFPARDGWLLSIWDGRPDTPLIYRCGLVPDDTTSR